MVPAPYPPDDFDAFWGEAYLEADGAPLDFDLTDIVAPDDISADPHGGQTHPGVISRDHGIRRLAFRGMAGGRLEGWVAFPESDPAPAFLWIAPYGRESLLPNQYGTRPGYVSLSFNFFGHGRFHQEKYVPANGYLTEGVDDPRTWIFRTMFQDCVLATRVLASLPEVDETRLASMGMSQGGGLAIWQGAWNPRIRAVCADMPFLAAMHETLIQSVYRYPLKELLDFMGESAEARARVMRTLSYFDTLNQATRCDKPTQVSFGRKDPAVKPLQVQAVYAALPGEKRLIEYAGGHDWDPGMVANDRDWLFQHL